MTPAGASQVALATGDLLLGGAVLVVTVRGAVALAEARLRAGGWPLWRCGPAVPVLLLHDVAVGLVGYALCAVLPVSLVSSGPRAPAPLRTALAGTLLGLALTGPLLRRRRGLPLAAVGRPGALSQEPVLTARGRLLAQVGQAAAQDVSRWITARLSDCKRRTPATDDQLLPAVWGPARIRLRESVGVGRTEVALLLLQAQSVVDDASPPRERLLTLLHLVHERVGRRAVRAVLDEARRGGGLRNGRASAPVPVQARTSAG